MIKKFLVLSLFVVIFLFASVSQTLGCHYLVVGNYFDDSSNSAHCFVYNPTNNQFTNHDFPGASTSKFWAINDTGYIVGEYVLNGTHGRLYNYYTGVTVTIDYPNSTTTRCYGINNDLVIVGIYFDTNGDRHSFSYDYNAATFTTIDHPQYTNIACIGINSHGDIVGGLTDLDGQRRAFKYDGADFYIVEPPNAIKSNAHDINSNGEIAGWYYDINCFRYGFYYNGSEFTTFKLGPSTGNNDDGVIIGKSFDNSKKEIGYLIDGNNTICIDHPDAVFKNPYGGTRPTDISNKVYY